MLKWTRVGVGAACVMVWAIPVMGANIALRGKVTMQDGSAPGKGILLERFCDGTIGRVVIGNTLKTGQYLFTADVDALGWNNCALRASLKGYESTAIPISHLNSWSDPNLPDIIMREHDASLDDKDAPDDGNVYFSGSKIPPNARKPWSNALLAMRKSDFAAAERQLRIVVKEAPTMAQAWNYLGDASEHLNHPDDAIQAYESAARNDPKLTVAQVGLLRALLKVKKWPEAEAAAETLIQHNADFQYPEIDTNRAVALYNLGNLAGAQSSVEEGIRRDTKHQLPRSEIILASVLEAQTKYDGAREHLQRYLDLDPRATDAADIRDRMNNLGKSATGGPLAPTLEAIGSTAEAAGEAWVPGGMKALAKMAGMPGEPAYQTFFEDYCRAIGSELSVKTTREIPKFTEGLRTFLASVTELIPLGEKRGEGVVIRISVASPERRQQSQRVLALLGWTVEERDGAVHVEPGFRAQDALLQTVAVALGIDQIAMQEKLQSGAEFQFEIISESARLVGGNTWTQILIQNLVPAGGLAAVFATDIRIAKTCAGLNAMNAGTAASIMTAVGLRNLAAKYTEVVYRYGAVFAITGGRVDVPGGTTADPAWQKLVGANPNKPDVFFRALLEKDTGRMAAFYSTLAHADAAHQQYFTRSPERFERFYRWFRDSAELKSGIYLHTPGFQSEFLQAVPLDNAGNIRFPGGQSAWYAGTEIPLGDPSLEALVPVSRLEQKRGSPLDAKIAELLVRNYAKWNTLYPYFESLPAMGQDEYSALAAFEASVASRPAADANAVLGEWYALVELITRGAKAGSLDPAAAAHAFRQVSLDLSGDKHTAQSVALLRSLTADNGDLEESVATNLLRLDAARRERFNRVLELLRAPRMTDLKPNDVPVALSALVYAASLDPGLLVLNEDAGLLKRHRYFNPSGPLFARAKVHRSDDADGTHFSGGFSGFEDASKGLMGGAKAAPRVPIVARSVPQPVATGDSDAPVVDFRSDSNLVEVYTTVTDNRGRYVDDLTAKQFTLLSGKDPQTILAFEPQTSDLSVALLLDTTGSMADAIASLKRAANKLVDSLRPNDSVAVYSFNDQVTQLAPFTTDRGITKRAVMNVRPYGNTALYDSVARMGHELTGRSGKKVVIVFTDGRDSSSMLTVDAAIERAKVSGVPVYTIAEGDAITTPELLRQLTAISTATGGASFEVRHPDDMTQIFEKVAEDLAHGYLLFFQPPSVEDHAWREIGLAIGGRKDVHIRARQGYYP